MCHDLPNATFYCHCPDGYFGYQCEYQTCSSNPCAINNTVECTAPELGMGFQCICENHSTGERCEIYIEEFDAEPCKNNATRIDLGDANDFSCNCTPGYTGRLCEEDIDECVASPCQNDAVCTDLVDNFSCSCVPGYTGDLCETEVKGSSLWMIVVAVIGTLIIVAIVSSLVVVVLATCWRRGSIQLRLNTIHNRQRVRRTSSNASNIQLMQNTTYDWLDIQLRPNTAYSQHVHRAPSDASSATHTYEYVL